MDGTQTRISRAFVRAIRKMTPFVGMTTAASVVGSHGAVGRVRRRLDCEVGSTVCTGWRWRLSIAFRTKARNGGSTQQCPFGHNRFLEAPEKLDVETREPTYDTLTVVLRKMTLGDSS